MNIRPRRGQALPKISKSITVATLSVVLVVATLVAIQFAPSSHAATVAPWVRPGIARQVVDPNAVKAVLASVSVPTSQDQLGWISLGSLNEVEQINVNTGEVYGSPMALPSGDSPVAISYWRPNLGYTTATSDDPIVVVISNNTSTNADYATFIDALTKTVLSTISLGGTYATAVATSTQYDLAGVTDSNSAGTASRLKIISMVSKSVIETFSSVVSTTRAITDLSFDSSGTDLELVAPTLHKVYYFEQTGSGSTTFTQPSGTTYTGSSSFDPVAISIDPTSTSSTAFYLTGTSPGPKDLWSMDAIVPSFTPTLTVVKTFPHYPGDLQINAGSSVAYVDFPLMSTSNVGAVNLITPTSAVTYTTATTTPNALALSWDSGTLLVGDGASGTSDLPVMATYSNTVTTTGTVAGPVTGIALPISSFIHYDLYVVNGSYVSVIDSSTGGIIANIVDSNSPLTAISSPDGRDIYIVNNTGGGALGTSPEVLEYSTALLGSLNNPLVNTYVINQSQSSPISYSLAHVPVLAQAAMSPSGDSLLLTDSANSDVMTLDVSTFDGTSYDGKVVSELSLHGSTAATPEGISILPDGSYAYVSSQPVSGGGIGGITALAMGISTVGYGSASYQSGSALADTPPSGYSAISLDHPTQIQTSNNGQFLYVLDTNSTLPALFAFAVTTSGALGTDPNPAFAAGTTPVSFSLSPEDTVAYVSDSTTAATTAMSLTGGVTGARLGHTNFSSSSLSLAPGATASTPDGQYFAAAYTTGLYGGYYYVAVYNSSDGSFSDAATVSSGAPRNVTVSPVSSSQWLTSTLAYDGATQWPELLQGGANESERAASSMVDLTTAGTPADAPGVTAGTETNLRAYSFSLNSMNVPSLGLPLSLSASYDSERVVAGMDSSSSIPNFAFGWRLSTGVTGSQNATSGTLFPCRITITQSDGTQIFFNPSSSIGSSCPSSGYEPLPWEQDSLNVLASCTGSGSDACWDVTNLLSGVSTYLDATASSHPVLFQQDRNANTVTYSYSSGKLTSVANSGRALSVSYPSAGTGTCPTSFNSVTIATCWVVTDPLARSVTYDLAGSPSTGYDLEGVTLAAPSGSSAPSASYAFSYSGHLMTSWWDPANYAAYPGNTAEATDVTYAATTNWVTQVTGPEVTSQGVTMSASFTPTTTFVYPSADLFSGDSSVIITDANANYNSSTSSSLPGANVTLDTYVDWALTSQVQGYGPSEAPSVNPTAVTSESATTLRDPLTLMPVESISALADTGTGAMFNSGISFSAYDVLGNTIESWSPGINSSTWASTGYTYNQLNEALSSTDALGHVSYTTYSSTGHVLSTTTPATNNWTSAPVTSNFYNANGTLCASRDANEVASYGTLSSCSTSHDTVYSYNSYGDLTTTTSPLGSVNSNYFDADGNACASLTPDGYAGGERLTGCPSSAQPDENVTLSLNVYNSATSSAGPSNAPGGTSWTFFNLNNGVVASVSVLGNPSTCSPLTTTTCLHTSYSTYDPNGQVVSSTSPTPTSGTAGPTSTTFFDPNGNSVASVSPAGNASGAPASFEQVSVTNSLGTNVASTPATSLAASCAITATTGLCPNTSFSLSDAAGNQLASYSPNSSGAASISSTTAYDPAGNVATTAAATSATATSTTTNAYDVNGDQIKATTVGTSGSGSVTTGSTTTYEPNGAICWSSPLAWTGTGAPTCSSPPVASGNQTTMNYYDAAGHLVAVSGPGSSPYASANTSGCNPLVTSTCSFTTYYTFNEAGQQVTAVQPLDIASHYPTTTNYFDASGNQVAVTGPAGSPGTCNALVTSTCADTIYTSYDAASRVSGVSYTDGTPSVTYSYNIDGSRASMVDGTGTTSYSYDAVGRMMSVTNGAGAVVTWGFNASGQEVCLSYPNSAGNTCASTGAGTSSPPSGDLSYSYDPLGRLASEATWTGVTLTYAFDCSGQVAWVSTGTASTTECAPGSVSIPAIPTSSSAVTTSYTSDATSGLSSQQATSTSAGSTNLVSFVFGRDQLGRITTSTPTTNAAVQNADSYGYDNSSRVSSGPIVGTTGSANYNYTTNGGITAATTAFAGAGYSPSGELCWTNPTTSAACGSAPSGSTTFSYNAIGERVAVSPPSGTPQSLSWQSSSQRLTCVNSNATTCSSSSPTATTTLYSYNGEGLRATSTNQSVTNSFVWDPSGPKLLTDSTRDYVYQPGSPTPILQIETTAFTTTPTVDLLVDDSNINARGLVQIEGDATSLNATLVAYSDYDAYGNPITASGGSANAGGLAGTSGSSSTTTQIGFASSYGDGSGLGYLIHRYYDPATGQFVSVDPMVSSTGAPYSYAGDNSISNSDPLGKMLCTNTTANWGMIRGSERICGLEISSVVYSISIDQGVLLSNGIGRLENSGAWTDASLQISVSAVGSYMARAKSVGHADSTVIRVLNRIGFGIRGVSEITGRVTGAIQIGRDVAQTWSDVRSGHDYWVVVGDGVSIMAVALNAAIASLASESLVGLIFGAGCAELGPIAEAFCIVTAAGVEYFTLNAINNIVQALIKENRDYFDAAYRNEHRG